MGLQHCVTYIVKYHHNLRILDIHDVIQKLVCGTEAGRADPEVETPSAES